MKHLFLQEFPQQSLGGSVLIFQDIPTKIGWVQVWRFGHFLLLNIEDVSTLTPFSRDVDYRALEEWDLP